MQFPQGVRRAGRFCLRPVRRALVKVLRAQGKDWGTTARRAGKCALLLFEQTRLARLLEAIRAGATQLTPLLFFGQIASTREFLTRNFAAHFARLASPPAFEFRSIVCPSRV
jgi:hypothetical protein